MIQSINIQNNNKYKQYFVSNLSFTSNTRKTKTFGTGINPDKSKRNKILKTCFFILLGIKLAILADIIFSKGKHIKAIWKKLRGDK